MHDHYSIIHYLYQLFYRKAYGNDNYVFSPTAKTLNHVNWFINKLDERYRLSTIGVNFLFIYFAFQFNYWSKLKLKAFSRRVNVSFIVGNKAFKRWENRNPNFDWTILRSDILKDISLKKIKSFFEENRVKLNLAEEVEKKKYHNTSRGLLNCIDNTTLYFHHSPLCAICKFKVDCKALLKNNYKTLFEGREELTIV